MICIKMLKKPKEEILAEKLERCENLKELVYNSFLIQILWKNYFRKAMLIEWSKTAKEINNYIETASVFTENTRNALCEKYNLRHENLSK